MSDVLDPTVQQSFFAKLEENNNTGEALSAILSDRLEISLDSAYRRLRNETSLSLEEAVKLAAHFNISLDELLPSGLPIVIFKYNWMNPSDFDYDRYLDSLLADLKSINVFDETNFSFMAKDFPLFYNFLMPEIAAFKAFFWQKSAFQLSAFKDRKFSLDDINDSQVAKGHEIARIYSVLPSSELWNTESLHSLLRQIEFYYQAGYFVKDYHADKLLDKVEKLVDHFQRQAESGRKFLFGKDPSDVLEPNYHLYFNELIIGDNTVYVKTDEHQRTYLSINVINTMYTTMPEFCAQTKRVHENMIQSSVKISQTSEKERNRYFNGLRKQIDRLRDRMED